MSEMDEVERRLEARVGKRFVEVLREFAVWEARRMARGQNDLVRRHSKMLGLARDLADLDVRAGDDGTVAGIVNVRNHGSRGFHGLSGVAPVMRMATGRDLGE